MGAVIGAIARVIGWGAGSYITWELSDLIKRIFGLVPDEEEAINPDDKQAQFDAWLMNFKKKWKQRLIMALIAGVLFYLIRKPVTKYIVEKKRR